MLTKLFLYFSQFEILDPCVEFRALLIPVDWISSVYMCHHTSPLSVAAILISCFLFNYIRVLYSIRVILDVG